MTTWSCSGPRDIKTQDQGACQPGEEEAEASLFLHHPDKGVEAEATLS